MASGARQNRRRWRSVTVLSAMVLGYQNVAEVRHLALLLVKRPVSLAMLAAIRRASS